MNSEVRSHLAGGSSQVSGNRSRGTGFRSQLPLALIAVLVISGAAGIALLASRLKTSSHEALAASAPQVSKVSLPLFFEPNQGQTDARVKFLARGVGYGLFLTSDEAVLSLQHSAVSSQQSAKNAQQPTSSVIRMRLVGSNPSATVSGSDRLPGKSNYFIGNDPKKWQIGIPQFARVNYEAVYPGVDLTYYGNQRQLEYDFRVAPGADPNQIALSFDGASPRIDAGELVLSTPHGDVRFHAPEIYQQVGSEKHTVPGSFRQLAEDKIGFEIGTYDRSRELVIDPVLSYATFVGGAATESLTRVAVDSGFNMYVAGSTTSSPFPNGGNLPGSQNIFVTGIDATGSTVLFTTILGSSGSDLLAGLAVDTSLNIYLAGTTTSTTGNFPTAGTPFQTGVAGTHGFLSKLTLSGGLYNLSYSTYLAGNGSDVVTGLAIDKNQRQHAFVTGTTTSTDSATGFPSTTSGYQICPFEPNPQNLTCTGGLTGPPQFFASQINTVGTGTGSMLYSTYFGGNNPNGASSAGGGITVDASERLYFTGSTNTLGVTGANGEHPFPLLNAQQSCLNEAGLTSGCAANPPTTSDAVLVKINPAISGTGGLVYSTFLGGSDTDFGTAVSVDSSGNAYVTGGTFSNPWNLSNGQSYAGGGDAFIAKIGNPTGGSSVFPLTSFQYLGGSNQDVGTDIVVDNVQAAHVTGWTDSPNFPVTQQNNLPPGGGARDAFVALISTTGAAGNYSGFLGGTALDQGTSIALDPNLDSSPAFVGGITKSADFPTNSAQPPIQGFAGAQDAFVARIGSQSGFSFDSTNSTVNPTPAAVGNQVTFKFVFNNGGPDPASNVIFSGALPASGFTFSSASSTPGGTCPNPVSSKVTCTVGTVASGSTATISVVLIPSAGTASLSVTPSLSANGSGFVTPPNSTETVSVTDFGVSVDPKSASITAGQSTSFVITLSPVGGSYANSISVSHSTLPTGATGTFTSSSVTISGNTPATTTLNISTTARPVQTGALWPSGRAFYATWLPVSGLSLLGFGVGWKGRRWVVGTALGLLAGLILLQPACGGSSSSNTTPGGGTPAGTYSITLTGSSGSAKHDVTVTLNVK